MTGVSGLIEAVESALYRKGARLVWGLRVFSAGWAPETQPVLEQVRSGGPGLGPVSTSAAAALILQRVRSTVPTDVQFSLVGSQQLGGSLDLSGDLPPKLLEFLLRSALI